MSDLSDSTLLRVVRLLRRAEDGGPEGEAAARELGRLADRGLHCARLGGREVQAALMVLRESTGCEVVSVGDRYFAVGTRREVSDARAACAFLLEAWERAWQESQRPAARREPAGLFGAGGWSVSEHLAGGTTLRLHVSGDLPELAALFAQSLAPPTPRDREAFLVGLAQGAFADVVRRRGSQRPPSILARQEMAEAHERARSAERERAAAWAERVAQAARGAACGGCEPRPVPGDSAEGRGAAQPPNTAAQAKAAYEARRRAADAQASMAAGRAAAARVRSAGILFRLRRMPPALPAH